MTTRNKLQFLRHAFPLFLSSLQEDEEIVVVDGASTDGTTEYLQNYYEQGKIHQFLSEPDKGEAHALNKGLLMAKGELVASISDDDVFHYPTLQQCKEYMLANPEVDILGSDGGMTYWGRMEPFAVTKAGQEYEKWVREGCPFVFPGLGMMLRRRSVALLGLFATNFISVDHEYCRRVSTLPVCMAWHSRLSFVHFSNPASNEYRHQQRISDEIRRFNHLYNIKDPPLPMRHRLIGLVKQALGPIKDMLIRSPSNAFSLAPVTEQLIAEAIGSHSAWLDKQNESRTCSFRKAVRGSSRVS